MKISEILRLPEQDGWALNRTAEIGYPGPADADSVTILDPAAA